MDEPIENCWQLRLAHVKKALEGNDFRIKVILINEESGFWSAPDRGIDHE